MGLFDGYVDPEQFRDSGGLLGRLLSLQHLQDQYQLGAGFDQAPSVSQTPVLRPTPWPNLPGYGPSSGEPTAAPNLASQYQALRPVLGDHNTMLATVNPEIGKTLIAQALANQQAGNTGNVPMAGHDRPVVSDASPDPIRPGSQYAQGPMALCAAGPAGCAVGAGLTAGQLILGGAAVTGAGAFILNNQKQNPLQTPPLPEKLIGNNARPGIGRAKTDLPGIDPTPDELFDRLTGGQSISLPDGTRVGPNGVRLRPDTGSGPRIDVPANDEKQHETIHFPGSNQ